MSDIYDENLTEMMGVGLELERIGECRFKLEDIVYKDMPKTKSEVKPIHVASVASADAKEEDYLAEIEELRRKLREKEEESKHFRQLYDQTKASLSDAQNANYMEELITLRNYVYSLSQEPPAIEESKLEDMKGIIAEKSVIIIS